MWRNGSYKTGNDGRDPVLLDLRNHEDGLDGGDSTKGSNKSPPSHEDVSNLTTRPIAVSKEARNGRWQPGKAIVRDQWIEPSVDINVPAFDAHLASILILLLPYLLMLRRKQRTGVDKNDRAQPCR